jgi:hypothetical protein
MLGNKRGSTRSQRHPHETSFDKSGQSVRLVRVILAFGLYQFATFSPTCCVRRGRVLRRPSPCVSGFFPTYEEGHAMRGRNQIRYRGRGNPWHGRRSSSPAAFAQDANRDHWAAPRTKKIERSRRHGLPRVPAELDGRKAGLRWDSPTRFSPKTSASSGHEPRRVVQPHPGITITRETSGEGLNIAIRGLGTNFTRVLLNRRAGSASHRPVARFAEHQPRSRPRPCSRRNCSRS